MKIDRDGTVHVYAREAIVCSDWHIPGESKYWHQKLNDYAKSNKIRTLIIAGDFWNFDSISKWAIKDKNLTLSEEIERGLEILKSLCSKFNVYLVCGNHDRRIVLALDGAISFKDWMNSFDIKNLFVTDHDFLYLHSNSVTFRICHPEAYSKIKGSVVSKLSHAKQENIIMGHQHFISVSTDITSKYIAVDCGCMCDIKSFYYKNSTTNMYPDWENGFIHVKNGKIKLISRYSF